MTQTLDYPYMTSAYQVLQGSKEERGNYSFNFVPNKTEFWSGFRSAEHLHFPSNSSFVKHF